MVRIPLAPPEFAVDWQRVGEAITPRTRMIVVKSPHNPTGSVLGPADLDPLEELVQRHGLLLLSDEVYEHLVYDGAAHHSVLARPALAERAFAVFSFGKTFNATSWKVGHCVAAPALTAEFRKVRQFLTFAVSTPMQHAIADFLREQPGFADGQGAFYQAQRDRFAALLAGSRLRCGPSMPSSADLLHYKIPTALDMPELHVYIAEKSYEPTGPFGAKSVGELPVVGVAPAIVNAVAAATGEKITTLPLSNSFVTGGSWKF